MSAVEFDGVTFSYPDGSRPALEGVTTACPGGDITLVIGESGSGKSTLLRSMNGLVPHHSGGTWAGSVRLGDRSIGATRPRDLASVVGFVHQDPEAQFVTDRVEADLAFGLENLGVDARTMRRRVEEVLDALGIAHLRDRHPGTLSGGEQQRAAIAGALAIGPSVLVLDEPTSQLDPQGAEAVLATLTHLNQELGITVVMAEHRLERVAPMADRAITIREGRVGSATSVSAAVARYSGAPSLARLARLLDWDPIPLTVRDARREIAKHPIALTTPRTEPRPSPGPPAVTARRIRVTHDRVTALHTTDVTLHVGEVAVVLGRNGAGKSSLLQALAGLAPNADGTVEHTGGIAYVPQNPNSLLFARTVRAEVAETLRLRRIPDPGGDRVDDMLNRLGLTELALRNPRDLSGGERQRVAIAAVAVGGASVLLLDEPTRGMDAHSRAALESMVRAHAATGGTVALATHDVELAARIANRAIVLAEGEIIADGDARSVLCGSLFAPQISRVLPGYLTVTEVALALDELQP